MADEQALRQQLDTQRERLDDTIEQIGERVVPGRVIKRKRAQYRNRFIDLKDRVMGNDEPDYYGRSGGDFRSRGDGRSIGGLSGLSEKGHEMSEQMGDRVSAAGDSVRHQASSAAESVSHAPEAVRRQTRGNPAAAGFIAFGAGLLAAALIPETEREQRAVQRIQPELESATTAAASTGREMVDDMREPAQEAAEAVKETVTHGHG